MNCLAINKLKSGLLIGAFLGILGLQACKDDGFLDVTNTIAVNSQTTFSTTSASDLVLNDIYNSLPDMHGFVFDPFENFSDNAMTGYTWVNSCNGLRNRATITSNTSMDDLGSVWGSWTAIYANIRKCNLFIEGVNASSFDKEYKDTRIGEARTLRAYFYQTLWMFYGGVPIITKPDDRSSDGDAIFHARASFDETFKFIDKELAEAAVLMQANAGNNSNGRVTKGTALTLKGWVELFYASPLNNPTNDVARWATAAATNKQVMQLGYSLHPKYDELFFSSGTSNNEGIFYRQYLANVKGSQRASLQGPRAIGTKNLSWGGSNPSQDLVDDYAMMDGTAINDPGTSYQEKKPYANREPRFYQSILSTGNTINGVVYSSAVGSGLNEIDLADASDGPNTGYNMKKWMDTTVNVFQNGLSSQNYYFFRYAEVLLNYAEAQNEAMGPDEAVYAAMNAVRNRAGIPNFSTVYPSVTKVKMRELIRRERRVELAFEDKRYFDLIRWKIAETKLNKVMMGMKVTGTPGNYTYTRVPAISPGAPQWTFDPRKNYLYPIPFGVMAQNKSLAGQQNPGY